MKKLPIVCLSILLGLSLVFGCTENPRTDAPNESKGATNQQMSTSTAESKKPTNEPNVSQPSPELKQSPTASVKLEFTHPVVDQRYYLEHKHSGKFVCTGDKDNGNFVHLYGPIPENHKPRYQFKLLASDDSDYVYLVHQHSGKYLCMGHKEKNKRIYLWGPMPANDADHYKFKLVDVGDGYYYLLHKHSGHYVCTGAQENNSPVHTWSPVPKGQEDRFRFRFALAE